MHKETAEVIKVTDDKVFLKVEKKAMCGCCKIASACNKNQGIFAIPNTGQNLKEKDSLELEIKTKRALQAVLTIFFAPLLIFIFFLVFFQAKGELKSFLLAFLAMVVYYVVIKIFLRKTKKFDITILRKI